MPKPRQPKWDWAAHFPLMAELYNRGQTIPKIHEAVQSESFRPSQRAVYNKFNLEGFSTEHGRRPNTFHAESPADMKAGGISIGYQSPPLTISEVPVSEDGKSTPAEIDTELTTYELSNLTEALVPHLEFGRVGPYSPTVLQPVPEDAVNKNLATPTSPDCTRFTEHNVAEEARLALSSNLGASASVLDSAGKFTAAEPEAGQSRKRGKRSQLKDSDNLRFLRNCTEIGLIDEAQHVGGRTRPPHRPKETCRQKSSLRKMYSTFFNQSSDVSESGRSHRSSFADTDSGYGSSLASTFYFRDSLMSHPQSLKEFRGLHRVACQVLHDPQNPDQHKETLSCHYCGFSSVHSLAWSSTDLSLQEFDLELMLKDPSDVQALDAAGNSALHYAAAAGSSSGHLKALIRAGVPAGAKNTASQNFLHCLRRCNPNTENRGLDCFKSGLIEFLEFIEPKSILAQQDNDGQTALHVLALNITEPELRDQTFKAFSNYGFSTTIPNRFLESAKDLSPSDYKPDQTMFAADTFSTLNSSRLVLLTPASEWQTRYHKQMGAYDVVLEAHNNPRYVDRRTQDTILHALSRVNVQSKGTMHAIDIVQHLRNCVGKGANLNRHNCDGHHPLAAFICNQDFRGNETGATLAKYVNILLWKDGKYRDGNDINVNMMTTGGSTALYEAAIRAQPDSVRSLIEAGANVNARLNNDPQKSSVLQATFAARDKAVLANDHVRIHIFREVISHLEHEGAVVHPTSLQERGCAT